MSIDTLGPDVLAHILSFAADSFKSWAVLLRVNKLFNSADLRWHFEVKARGRRALRQLGRRRWNRVCNLKLGDYDFPAASLVIPPFPFLTKLHIYGCGGNLTLSTVYPSLTDLCLRLCDVDDDGMRLLPDTLQSLTLIECTKITGASLRYFRHLKRLHLKFMKLIELPTTLQFLGVQNCLIETTSLPTTLQRLDLQHCDGLTDIPLLPELHTLTVLSCNNVKTIADQPKLRAAWIDRCVHLDNWRLGDEFRYVYWYPL
jgi:hypothetical protein